MNTSRNILLSLSVLVTLSSCSQVNDFNLTCNYFDMLQTENKKNALNPKQKFLFIDKLVHKNLPSTSAARQTWEAIVGFVPAEGRYNLYKEAAEVTLNAKWQCSSMKILLKNI